MVTICPDADDEWVISIKKSTECATFTSKWYKCNPMPTIGATLFWSNILNFIYRCAFCRFVFQYVFDNFYLVKFEIVWYIFQNDIDSKVHGKILIILY